MGAEAELWGAQVRFRGIFSNFHPLLVLRHGMGVYSEKWDPKAREASSTEANPLHGEAGKAHKAVAGNAEPG
ncbi:hypothetical protein [Desulfosporosinus orientis]|uniref:hypothetical protein n=1 Tax=Desulfosporosinus orientis TaxID=1563 RepID=UPI00031F39A9|nr:hypothetical protein [Desulfosporosinus orientis]